MMIMKTNTGYLSAHKTPSLLRRSAPLLRDAGQRGVQALSVLLLCCTCPSCAVLVLLVLYLCVYCSTWLCGAVLVRPVLCLFLLQLHSTLPCSALLCCTCLCSAVLIHVVLIPDICQFWYIIALFRPVKSTPKNATIQQNYAKIGFLYAKKSTPT